MESEDKKPLFTKRLLLIVVAVILLVLIVFLLLKRCGNGGGNFKVDQINLTPTRVNLKIGEQQQIYANVYPSDAKNSNVYWESEDPTIASVDQNGVVTGINNGITTITAKANDGGGAVGSTTVTVGDDLPELEQIQLNKSIYTVKVGSTVLIEATPVPSTAQLLDIKYSTRDTNIATVDSSGRIKGVKVGSTIVTITANEGKVQTTATVKVVENSSGGTTNPNTPSDAKIPVSAISLTATETCYKLKVGNSYTIETKILPNNATDKTLTWEVVSAEDASDAAKNKVAKTYASVSNTGVVKGLKAGNVKIKITAKSGVYSYFDIKVISSGNEGYCTTSSGGNSGGNTGGNTGGSTSVPKPLSVMFRCATEKYDGSCLYNVGILLPGASELAKEGKIDAFYSCLSTGADCTPDNRSSWDSISKSGYYKYCALYEKNGKKSAVVCSEKKYIIIDKKAVAKITGGSFVKPGEKITLVATSVNFAPTSHEWKSETTSCITIDGAKNRSAVTLLASSNVTTDCIAKITVTMNDKNNNALSTSVNIKVTKSSVNKDGEVTITGSNSVKSGGFINLTATPIGFDPVKYKWTSNNSNCVIIGHDDRKTAEIFGISSITSDCTVKITLKVTDKNGKSLTATKTIKVVKSSSSVKAPNSVGFGCGGKEYSGSCQYNVMPRVSYNGTRGTDYDYANFCLTTGSTCEPNSSDYTTIKESGTYVYCVSQVKDGKKSTKVCSPRKEIVIVEKSQTSESIKTPTIKASSNNKTYNSGSWTNGTVDIVLGGASEDEEYYRSSTKVPTGNKETISDEGIKDITYKICKKSNPSTCGNSKTIKIRIDKTAPTCDKITGDGSSSNWEKSRTINVACSDSASGCEQAKYEKTWDGNYSITTGYVRLKDRAGNEKLCPVNIYVDPVPPKITCEVISESANGVGVKVTASDAASGLADNPSVSTTIKKSKSYSAKDKAGNSASCTITVTWQDTYENQQKRYPCTKPTWRSSNTTWLKSCSASNSSSSNTSSYTTCQYVPDVSACGANGQTAPCYISNTYVRKGCDAYSATPDKITYPKNCEKSNWSNNYYKFSCQKMTASKIYRGKVSY